MKSWHKSMIEDINSYEKKDESGEILYFKDLGTTNKLKVGVQTRLELMSPYVDKWPQAMALGLAPSNL